MGRLDGKVALVTGAARGQGRAEAIRLADEGAHIIAVDICHDVESVPYSLASSEDLAETVREVEALDRRIVSHEADVRDLGQLRHAIADGIAQFGRLDAVVANAGVVSGYKPSWELTEKEWTELIDVNLTGVWNTLRSAAEVMVDQNEGGAMVVTSSIAGLKGFPLISAYTASKHGVIGVARTFAYELAQYKIRVNTIHPTTVLTPMVQNEAAFSIFAPPEVESPTLEDATPGFQSLDLMPVPWVETSDVASAVAWLVSDEARYVTGATLTVDAGAMVK